jgi:site-specific DNA-methyltransferase (adenine-specific)
MMQDEGWILRNTIIWNRINPMPSFSEDRRIPIYEYVFHFVKSPKYFFNYEIAKKLNHHRDIISCGVEKYKNHEASFPEKLIEPVILTTSMEGDIVMDPFMGSGTTAVVAKKLNRNYSGIELLKANCIDSEERLKQLDENLFAKL